MPVDAARNLPERIPATDDDRSVGVFELGRYGFRHAVGRLRRGDLGLLLRFGGGWRRLPGGRGDTGDGRSVVRRSCLGRRARCPGRGIRWRGVGGLAGLALGRGRATGRRRGDRGHGRPRFALERHRSPRHHLGATGVEGIDADRVGADRQVMRRLDQEMAIWRCRRVAEQNLVGVGAHLAAGIGRAGNEYLAAVDLDRLDRDFRRAGNRGLNRCRLRFCRSSCGLRRCIGCLSAGCRRLFRRFGRRRAPCFGGISRGRGSRLTRLHGRRGNRHQFGRLACLLHHGENLSARLVGHRDDGGLLRIRDGVVRRSRAQQKLVVARF